MTHTSRISNTERGSAGETIRVRDAGPADAQAVVRIYNHYVNTSIVTFEEEPVKTGDIVGRMDAVRGASLPWMVADKAGQIIGYAYSTPWKVRTAYRYSVEASVYVDSTDVGLGTGSLLYTQLFSILQAKGIHVVIAGISLPNEGSVALHEKFGFHKVAHFYEVGFKSDRWIDVGYWQKTL